MAAAFPGVAIGRGYCSVYSRHTYHVVVDFVIFSPVPAAVSSVVAMTEQDTSVGLKLTREDLTRELHTGS